MRQTIDNYAPQTVLHGLKKQARTVWSVSLTIVLVWLFLIVLAPLTADAASGISAPIYRFFGFVCHQQTERSFHFDEHAFAVCARCFGVYFGLLAGFAVYPFFRRVEDVEPLPRAYLFLAMIPMGVDWALGAFDVWANTHVSRFSTGAILGAACGVYIVPALVEIARLTSGRAKRRTKI